MSKSKTILIAILLCALLPLTASATITRVIGLGGEGSNYIIKDASNPQIWPELIVNYPNLAGAEFGSDYGSWDFEKAYVNYNFNKCNSVLQLSLDKNPNPDFWMGPDTLNYLPGGYNRLSLIYGRTFDNFKIGLGLNYASKSLKHDSTRSEYYPYGLFPKRDASYSTVGLNLGFSALEDKLDASVGFEFAGFSDKLSNMHNTDSSKLDNDGSNMIKFAARYWYTVNDHYALIPNLKFMTMKDAAKGSMHDDSTSPGNYYHDMNESGSMSETRTSIALGIGNNWTPVEDMLAIFELGIVSQTTKYESKYHEAVHYRNPHDTTLVDDGSSSKKDKLFDVYWRLGFETKIFGWLNGRLGAERTWVSAKNESEGGTPDVGYAATYTYLGATAHWNRLYLDLLVQPDFIQNGPNFISGNSSNMFSRVSLKYDFNK
jgi:hypothetical protein